MGVVRRQEEWTLEKIEKGRYAIKRRKQKKAEIITKDYIPNNNPLNNLEIMTEQIEVKNFKQAEKTFKNYIKNYKQNPFKL
ncbi:hypothetical protein AMET1_0536 [Methanonatronarchaeum thermophilum]|uniref:Uncharacterized protein n=1 Tax=Methanonatronarchaeum thermophilum TaxID=1927129 RepID=A0A1Y3GHH0_9EURY|nr:hypothetical protein [Methanonatronarchaeum thermophilum]OUJ18885.1 hypothetical protein AMET1_0536 [Methanonatronarchaeum thermophilum]